MAKRLIRRPALVLSAVEKAAHRRSCRAQPFGDSAWGRQRSGINQIGRLARSLSHRQLIAECDTSRIRHQPYRAYLSPSSSSITAHPSHSSTMAIEVLPLPLPPSVDASKFADFGREVKGVNPGSLTDDQFKEIAELLYKVNVYIASPPSSPAY